MRKSWYKIASTVERICSVCKKEMAPPTIIDDGSDEVIPTHGYCMDCYLFSDHGLLGLIKQKIIPKAEALRSAENYLREELKNQTINQTQYQQYINKFNTLLSQN